MKSKFPHIFRRFASNFTLESIIESIAYLSFDLIKHPDKDMRMFATHKNYRVFYNGKLYNDTVQVYQTNLIDIVYDLIQYDDYGDKNISINETLFLIHTHVNYEGTRQTKSKGQTEFWLKLFGLLGEQKRFQSYPIFWDDFSREKYILEIISKKKHEKNQFNIDFQKDFLDETSFSPDSYSAIVFALFVYFSECKTHLNPSKLDSSLINPVLSKENIIRVLNNYSATISEIVSSPLQRQAFYLKPIIKLEREYICINPFLLLCTFVNSNFWIMRNKYINSSQDTQRFTNAFGKYFEIYFEELLQKCLESNQFTNIPESNNGRRADWHIKLNGMDFLVEQKSAISFLGIKQTHPDINKMKTHILLNWGKAVKQLDETQKFLKLDDAIKIILVYEDYYKSECLNVLFDLDSSLTNDRKYWLVTIREFEMLMHTYKTDPDLFLKIVSEKNEAEATASSKGRDLIMFLANNGVTKNHYLTETGIAKQFDKITALCK